MFPLVKIVIMQFFLILLTFTYASIFNSLIPQRQSYHSLYNFVIEMATKIGSLSLSLFTVIRLTFFLFSQPKYFNFLILYLIIN